MVDTRPPEITRAAAGAVSEASVAAIASAAIMAVKVLVIEIAIGFYGMNMRL